MSWIPTFTTVPPPTAAKSHDTGPDVLLIELLGGVPVWAETDGVSLSNNIKTGRLSQQTAAAQVKGRMTLMSSRPPRHIPSEEAVRRNQGPAPPASGTVCTKPLRSLPFPPARDH